MPRMTRVGEQPRPYFYRMLTDAQRAEGPEEKTGFLVSGSALSALKLMAGQNGERITDVRSLRIHETQMVNGGLEAAERVLAELGRLGQPGTTPTFVDYEFHSGGRAAGRMGITARLRGARVFFFEARGTAGTPFVPVETVTTGMRISVNERTAMLDIAAERKGTTEVVLYGPKQNGDRLERGDRKLGAVSFLDDARRRLIEIYRRDGAVDVEEMRLQPAT
ncbi:MAG: hypothetical protein KGH72_02265 [Candidatus Micrarchaeota archaeon]|nr:hypothetical protein [Candidatus Micrarchaeota archaeon]